MYKINSLRPKSVGLKLACQFSIVGRPWWCQIRNRSKQILL